MLIKRAVVVGLAASLFANASFAAGVRMFKFEETPDPREVASVLSQSSPPPGMKMRSIRMIPAGAEIKSAEPTAEGETPVSPLGPDGQTAPPKLAFAPGGTATDTPPVATEAKPYAPTQKTDDLPSSLALPVQFAFDSARIMPAAYRQLDAVAAGIKLASPGVKVVIEGHTDSIGSAEYNLRLSSQRAEAVRGYLIARHGLDPARLRVVGMGKFAPLDKTTPSAPENRRVEFRAEA